MRILRSVIYISIISSLLFIQTVSAGITTNDTYLEYQTYLDKINIGMIWQSYTGKGVIVAVLDSGVQQNNPDIKDSLWKNTFEIPNNGVDDDHNGYIDDYYGYNFIANNANMYVYESHGTSVASLIAAQRNNSYGIAGIAPEVKIMTLTVCGSAGCDDAAINRAIIYAVDNGANIINMSLGSRGSLGYSSSHDYAVNYAINKGVLFVVSAGNSDPEGVDYGNDLNMMKQSPVSNETDANIILGVGATQATDNLPARWSSYGDKYVDVWAPGAAIVALSVKEFSGYNADVVNGTSFSAPMVAAAAALLKEKHPTWNYVDLMSQIISYSRTIGNIQFLNIYEIINGSDRKTELSSISPSVVNGEKKITVYGKNFYNDNKFSISNSSLSIQVPASAVKFIATNKAEIDLTGVPSLKADSNPYTLKVDNTSGVNTYNLSKQFTIVSLGQDLSYMNPPVANPTPLSTDCPPLSSGDLIKVIGYPTIFAVNKDLKVMAIADGDAFKSWNTDETYAGKYISITTACYDTLPSVSVAPLFVGFRPGSYLIRREGSTQLYAVLPNNTKAKISPEVAKVLYGTNYAAKTVKVEHFGSYVNDDSEITEGKVHQGMLVKVNGKTYYVDAGDMLREVTATGITANRFKVAFVRTVPASFLDGFNTGEAIVGLDAKISNRIQD